MAEADLVHILEDPITGFGWPIQVTSPEGLNAPDLVGFSNDISQLVDPDTGQAVSGRLATVSLRIASLTLAGFTELPEGVANTAIKPWLVTFDSINGEAFTFKVTESNPDRAIGVVVLMLEFYQNASN